MIYTNINFTLQSTFLNLLDFVNVVVNFNYNLTKTGF